MTKTPCLESDISNYQLLVSISGWVLPILVMHYKGRSNVKLSNLWIRCKMVM